MKSMTETIRRFWLDRDERFVVTGVIERFTGRPVTLSVNYVQVEERGEFSSVVLKGNQVVGGVERDVSSVSFLLRAEAELWARAVLQFPDAVVSEMGLAALLLTGDCVSR